MPEKDVGVSTAFESFGSLKLETEKTFIIFSDHSF